MSRVLPSMREQGAPVGRSGEAENIVTHLIARSEDLRCAGAVLVKTHPHRLVFASGGIGSSLADGR